MPKYLIGDAEKITVLLQNIVQNAVKYTKEGQIVMRAKWDPDEKSISLDDQEKPAIVINYEEVD